MLPVNSNNIVAAFDTLIEEIEVALNSINKAGANAFVVNDYEIAEQALGYAHVVMLLRDKISFLKSEWDEFNSKLEESQTQKTLKSSSSEKVISKRSESLQNVTDRSGISIPANRLIVGRIPKGLRTPEPFFFVPILEALIKLGGSAKRHDVYKLLERSMKGVLKPIDYQTLASEAGQMRWQNTAQWARNLMVKEGLLRLDSPLGIWQITEKGRDFLSKMESH